MNPQGYCLPLSAVPAMGLSGNRAVSDFPRLTEAAPSPPRGMPAAGRDTVFPQSMSSKGIHRPPEAYRVSRGRPVSAAVSGKRRKKCGFWNFAPVRQPPVRIPKSKFSGLPAPGWKKQKIVKIFKKYEGNRFNIWSKWSKLTKELFPARIFFKMFVNLSIDGRGKSGYDVSTIM